MTTETIDPAPLPATSAPRKRRRRAPATGAVDDCFSCANRQAKCDRRRPYCSQCLDQGKECSGYKTTLTWGVGVASRGKLRGLSLPIASDKKASSNASAPAQKKRNTLPEHGLRDPNHTRANPLIIQGGTPSGSFNSIPSTSDFDFVLAQPTSVPNFYPSVVWHPAPAASQGYSPCFMPPTDTQPLLPLRAPIPTAYEETSPLPSASSMGAHSYSEYASPAVYSSTSEESLNIPFLPHNTLCQRKGWHPMQDSIPDDRAPTSWPRNSLSSSPRSSLSSRGFYEPGIMPEIFDHQKVGLFDEFKHEMKEVPEEDEGAEEKYHESGASPLDTANGDFSVMLAPFNERISDRSMCLSQVVPSLGIGRTPRLKYLINYYAEVIAPVIVAFDGPTNPYKTHILPLAMKSETLQHAIAALSASNLRIRKEQNVMSTCKTLPAWRSSIAHSSLTDEKWQQQLVFLHADDPAREELFHKGVSIRSLNAQLADPVKRRNDSVLATLLILCLFHICDTGVAKFKTQFAGVKKLLALRGNEIGGGSEETKWYTRMFTWFDAFTATVNDREGQLSGGHLDMASLSDEEWSMENLAGCDGRLFKIIAKLGRLNVLSQNKPVENGEPIPIRMPRAHHFFASSPFDANSSLFDGDEDTFSMHNDSRSQFWREWKDVRQSLEEWELDMSLYSSTCATICAPNREDLSNISESFRFSALLYTERLVFPELPSSHPKIQSFVAQALHFITQVKSDVYLLWPLFITGSECIDSQHRAIIRQRCLDIQKDSGFFNNISCLELLEKIWRENRPAGPRKEMMGTLGSMPKIGGQGFKWRKVMDCEGSDGEYIVV